jgi:hypothetical protein
MLHAIMIMVYIGELEECIIRDTACCVEVSPTVALGRSAESAAGGDALTPFVAQSIRSSAFPD